MGSETCDLKLPAIDFSSVNLKPGTKEWELVKSQVRKAFEEFGCFEALFNKVNSDLKKGIVGAIQELFDLPLETKLKNVSKKLFHGYNGPYPDAKLYESIGFEDPTNLEKVESFTNALWPQGNPGLSKAIQSYSEEISELDKTVRRMAVESLGLEKYVDEHLNSTDYLLRVMKYNAPHTSEAQLGLHPHTDKNIITILYQNHVDGFGIQTKNGEWIDAKLSPDSFVVLTGDSFHAWTNGRLHSPWHRVIMSGDEDRYSCGLFTVPKAGIMVKAPDELIDEEHPLLFKPFDQFAFYHFYHTVVGQRAESALKAYCGV